MRVLIIEDEQPAAHKLIRLLREADKQTEVLDVLGSIELAINWLTNHPAPELIFMDIQLEDGISFEIFDLPDTNTCDLYDSLRRLCLESIQGQ